MPTTPLGWRSSCTWDSSGTRPARRAGASVRRARPAVVARVERDVHDLLEGVPAGLAVLQLDEVEHLVLPGQHEVVQPEQDGGPVGDAASGPAWLGGAGRGERAAHVLDGGDRQVRDRLAGERRPRRDPVAARRRDDSSHQPRRVLHEGRHDGDVTRW